MNNDIIAVSFLCMVVAQVIKIPFYYLKTGEWNKQIVFSTGSMPSSHAAVVVGLASATGQTVGFDSPSFAIAFVFAAITIHDAVKVRGESGKQAKAINSLTTELSLLYQSLNMSADRYKREQNLKELIGHTYSEVLGGILTGLLVTYIYFITL